ncbi:MAG: M10 family metallopeptidase C-terminal domain-containing protein [bacterium]|nr:M10 family metallopeptidase C-terminal domain-containing protein [bacterium]
MKKNTLLSDDFWAVPSFDAGERMPTPAPPTTDRLIVDEGEPLPLAASGAVSVSAGSAKPVASIATLAGYLVDGFWIYSGSFAHHWLSNSITYNITGLNAAEQFLAQSAMQAWHDVANVNFVQTSGTANITFTHDGTMQAVTNAAWYYSGAIAYATVNISQDWITNDGGAYDGKTGIDSYGYQTYIHEIGHALGLGHQGPYNGSASYSTNALYANDTWQYSIMSYFSEPNYSGSSYRYVVTPQMADIYAAASIYGMASSTRTGDTVYGFNSNAGAVFSFGAYSSAPALTIYDSSGNDTLDASGYSSAQVIDLHAGAFSSIGGLVNNIGIALGVTIEKAIGGSGNDSLTASDLASTLVGGGGNDTLIGGAGNDRLTGGTGVDTMTGGGGIDTFAFAFGDSSAASGQHDRITDFAAGIDRIDLSGIDAVSATVGYDQFRFIGTSAFDGAAGALNYSYNSSTGITTLQGDTNGDGVADFAIDLTGNIAINASDLIGAVTVPIVIESAGATTLTQVSASFYLYATGTTTGPTLKYAGSAFTAGQFGGWTPIGVEQVGSGYQVAWKISGADNYSIWSTDSSGNYISNLIGGVSGTSATFENFESSFHQDLNGDGIIGVPVSLGTVLEAQGATSLVKSGGNFYLNNISSGVGPTLKYGGSAFVDGQFGGWTPIAAEQAGSGYQVAWKMGSADNYSVWSTDSSGNYVSNVIGGVSGTSVTFENYETSFQQDLNGDGVIGVPANAGTVIEAMGSTSLFKSGSNYSLIGASTGTGPTLKYGGTPFAAGQFGGWTPIGVEQAGSGYQVAWKMGSADNYSVWSTDSNGNYITNVIGGVSGTSVTLENFETSFQQDLNGDGVIGVPSSQALLMASGIFAGNDTFEFGSDIRQGPSVSEFDGAIKALIHELHAGFLLTS